MQNVLHTTGKLIRKHPRRPMTIERRSNEWIITELAQHIPVPVSTLYAWVQKERLRSRRVRVGGCQITLVHADAAEIAMLRTVRATPSPWRRLPAPIAAASAPAPVPVSGES